MLAIIIGEKGSLTPAIARRRARLLAMALRRLPPDEIVDLSIYGYDDDPREIWEIVESRDYVIEFADALIHYGVPLERLLPQSQTLITVCRTAKAGTPVVTMGSYEDTIRESVDAILQHDRSQRTIH